MNTIAHVIVACAAFSAPNAPKRNLAVAAGAIVPDASMFVFFAWSRINGWSGDETWNLRYWMEPWQTLGAVSNSFILFALLLALSAWRRWPLWGLAAAAALTHLALDLPLHADDAHRHFWPLSNWRFQSPVSYWDPAANGLVGAAIETALVIAATALLWRRFSGLKTRTTLAVLLALQIAVFAAIVSLAR